jgi:glycosyltransferase involved in cell wall biosynthesis
MKILVSAYACEPGKGSEPGVGWNWVSQIARFHEVWVITRANNEPCIRRELEANPMPNVHWIFYDLPAWLRFWKKGERGLRPYYYLWQAGIYLLARRLMREVKFDIAHHITFVNYWLPSFLAFLPLPFVWGPVGGGESAPPRFRAAFSQRGRFYERCRDLARDIAQWDPFVRQTARRAQLGLATTHHTEARMRALGCRNVVLYSEAGLSEEEIVRLAARSRPSDTCFRVVSIGRLLHWKGFDLGVRAFARVARELPNSEYWIIGDGPERARLLELARELHVEERVRFWGPLPRQKTLEKLLECDVLLHPSLHDSGGWVCLESMAAGRPVVCLDLGGPAEQVNEQTGIRIRAKSPEQAVADISEALVLLGRNPDLRARLSQGGRQRVREVFNWNRKGEWMNEVYSTAYVATHY